MPALPTVSAERAVALATAHAARKARQEESEKAKKAHSESKAVTASASAVQGPSGSMAPMHCTEGPPGPLTQSDGMHEANAQVRRVNEEESEASGAWGSFRKLHDQNRRSENPDVAVDELADLFGLPGAQAGFVEATVEGAEELFGPEYSAQVRPVWQTLSAVACEAAGIALSEISKSAAQRFELFTSHLAVQHRLLFPFILVLPILRLKVDPPALLRPIPLDVATLEISICFIISSLPTQSGACMQVEGRVHQFQKIMKEGDTDDPQQEAAVPPVVCQGVSLPNSKPIPNSKLAHRSPQKLRSHSIYNITIRIKTTLPPILHISCSVLAEYVHAVEEWKGGYERLVGELERREFMEHMLRSQLREQGGLCEEPPLWLLQVRTPCPCSRLLG